MKRNYENGNAVKTLPYRLDIPFNEEERSRFLAFAKAHGKARGPWARIVLLRAMTAEEEALGEAPHV